MGFYIALYLGFFYLILEILIVADFVPWVAIFPYVFIVITAAATFISIKCKTPLGVVICFVVLTILDLYYALLSLTEFLSMDWVEAFYIEEIDSLLFPEAFPYVHGIIVWVCFLLLACYIYQKDRVDAEKTEDNHSTTNL